MSDRFDDNARRLMRLAADRHGIPYPILKTAILMESSGRWDPDRTFVELPNKGAIYPYTGMFDADVASLGYDPQEVRLSQEQQIDAKAAHIAFLKMSREWQGVFDAMYSGMKDRHMLSLNAITALKRIMGEAE